MSDAGDGEKTRQTKTGNQKNKRNNADVSRRLGATEVKGGSTGVEQDRTGNSNSQGENSIRSSSGRGTVAGGILRQLSEENRVQLAYHKAEIARLEKRQVEIDHLLEALIEKESRPLPGSNNNFAPSPEPAKGQN